MERRRCEERLEKKGIRPTAVRVLVLDALSASGRAVSLPELEALLGSVDKSSIFRTLNLFRRHHLVHALEDGSGALKYEVCGGEEACSVSDMHPHFYCECCRRTFCFEAMRIPPVRLPEGFVLHEINYMVKGICRACAEKGK